MPTPPYSTFGTVDPRISYDPEADLFVLAEEGSAPGKLSISHPLSVTLEPDESTGEEPDWDSIIQKLASWGVLRLHLDQAETVSQTDLQTIRGAASRSGLSLVLSIGSGPAIPDLEIASHSRLHVPVSPESSIGRLDFLGRHAAAAVKVRALTILNPHKPELFLELGSELAVRDIQEWTISLPPSSEEAHWLIDSTNAEPYIIAQLREIFPWMRIEHACFPIRESSLIVLPNGALFTTDPSTAERIFLGWLAEKTLADVLDDSAFDLDLHLSSWLHQQATENITADASTSELSTEQAQSFNAFVSYDNEDWPEVKEVSRQLKDAGVRVWIDKWELQPGDDWLKTLEGAMNETTVMLVFLGKKGEVVSPYQDWEPRIFLQEMKTKTRRLIPVILKSAPSQINLPGILKAYSRVDFRERDPDPFNQLVWGITGNKPPV